MNDLHGILFSYRSDSNLGDLTRLRNTCSLPFGGRYRLIDFMLSNYVNAGIPDVGVIVHESYQSLLDHLGSGKDWDLSRTHGGLRILPPFGYAEGNGGDYRGNMDALSGVSDYLSRIRQDYIIMGWGDAVLNLPVEDVLAHHLRAGADVTVVCTPAQPGTPRFSEYVALDALGRVSDLSVHPASSADLLESLEIYVLSKPLLINLVEHCSAHNIHSFSQGVLQPRLACLNLMPYLHSGYVARFQTVTDYFQHSMDLLNPAVRADLFRSARPIRARDHSNPSTYYGPNARCVHTLAADGCYIEGQVSHSILSREVTVEPGARVTNCVLMEGTVVKSGANLNCVITDKDVVITPDRILMGHQSYPLTIAKGSTV